MVSDNVYERLEPTDENKQLAFARGAQVSLIFLCCLLAGCLLIMRFRIGNTRAEAGKVGYKEEMVRELKDSGDTQVPLIQTRIVAEGQLDDSKE